MKRLGYLVPDFPSQTHAFFWREVQALRSMGVDVKLISTRRPSSEACAHAFASVARNETRYLFPPGFPSLKELLRKWSHWPAAFGYLASLSEKGVRARARHVGLLVCAAELVAFCREQAIEHVHVHSCADAAHVAALAHILCGLPYSVSIHGDLPVYGMDHVSKFRLASAVVPVTEPLRGQVLALSALDPSRVNVVTMGVDVDRFNPAADRSVRRVGSPLHVVTVARLNETKGHEFLLQAIAQLRHSGTEIVVTFAGEGAHRSAIEAKIRELDLSDRVVMAGTLGEDAVHALLRSADVFALTSFGQGEAAPVSVMEAMSCGLAVVCSEIGGTADMITHGEDGLLVGQRDVDAIGAAISQLLNDDYRERMGIAARRRAVRSFDYRVTSASLLDAISARSPPA